MEKWVKNKDNIFYHLNRVKGIKSEELYPLCGVERDIWEKNVFATCLSYCFDIMVIMYIDV